MVWNISQRNKNTIIRLKKALNIYNGDLTSLKKFLNYTKAFELYDKKVVKVIHLYFYQRKSMETEEIRFKRIEEEKRENVMDEEEEEEEEDEGESDDEEGEKMREGNKPFIIGMKNGDYEDKIIIYKRPYVTFYHKDEKLIKRFKLLMENTANVYDISKSYNIFVNNLHNYSDFCKMLYDAIINDKIYNVNQNNDDLTSTAISMSINITEYKIEDFVTEGLFSLFICNKSIYAYYNLDYYIKFKKMKDQVEKTFYGRYLTKSVDQFSDFFEIYDNIKKILNLTGNGKLLTKIMFGLNYIKFDQTFWKENNYSGIYVKLMEYIKKYASVTKQKSHQDKSEVEDYIKNEIKNMKFIKDKIIKLNEFLSKRFENFDVDNLIRWNFYFIKMRIKEKFETMKDEEEEEGEDVKMLDEWFKKEDPEMAQVFDKMSEEEQIQFVTLLDEAFSFALKEIETPIRFNIDEINNIIGNLSDKLIMYYNINE